MKKYEVVFVQCYGVEVEAENEEDAVKKAEDDFFEYARRPVARTNYDDVEVREIEDDVFLIPEEDEEDVDE